MEDRIFQQSIFAACSLYRCGSCHQPLFPIPLPPSSCSHYISCQFSGLRKHFNTCGHGHWTEKDIVERAQKAAVSATSQQRATGAEVSSFHPSPGAQIIQQLRGTSSTQIPYPSPQLPSTLIFIGTLSGPKGFPNSKVCYASPIPALPLLL